MVSNRYVSSGAQTEKIGMGGMTFIIVHRESVASWTREGRCRALKSDNRCMSGQTRKPHGEQTMQRKGIDWWGSDLIVKLHSSSGAFFRLAVFAMPYQVAKHHVSSPKRGTEGL